MRLPLATGAALAVLLMLTSSLIVATACGDDDGGGPASQTPFIAPSPYTTEVALQKLDEAELLIKTPDPDVLNRYGIGETDLQGRIELALRGTSDTTGLDDARAALLEENRILAAEYIYNVLSSRLPDAIVRR